MTSKQRTISSLTAAPFTQDQLLSVAEGVVYRAFEQSGILSSDDPLADLGRLRIYKARAYYAREHARLKTEVEAVVAAIQNVTDEEVRLATAKAERAKRIETVVQNWEAEVEPSVLDLLRRYGIEWAESGWQEEINRRQTGLDRHTRQPYETPARSSAPAIVRLFVALQPEVTGAAPDGSLLYEDRGYLGEPRMSPFGLLWNRIEDATSGIPPHYEEGEDGEFALVHPFDVMKARLLEEATFDPSLEALVARLERLPEQAATQFYNAFARVGCNFRTVSIVRRKGKPSQVRVGFGFSRERAIRTGWEEVAAYPPGFDPVEETTALVRELRGLAFDDAAARFASFLSDLGVGVSVRAVRRLALRRAVNTRARPEDVVLQMMARLVQVAKRKKGVSLGEVIGDEGSTFRPLAEAQAAVEDRASESTVLGPGGKWYYTKSYWTGFFQTVARLRGSDPALLKTLRSDTFGRASDWLARPDQIRAVSYLKYLDRSVEGSSVLHRDASPSELRESELYALEMAALMHGVLHPGQGIFPALNVADKTSSQGVSGPQVLSVPEYGTVQVEGGRVVALHNDIARRIARFALAEVTRRGVVEREIEAGEGLVDHYYVGGRNGLRLLLFPSLEPDALRESDPALYAALYEETPDGPRVRTVLEGEGRVLGRVADHVRTRVVQTLNEGLAKAERLRIIEADGVGHRQAVDVLDGDLRALYTLSMVEAEVGRLQRERPDVDRRGLNTLAGGPASQRAITALHADFALNRLLGDMEMLAVFHGDPAYYGGLDGLRERASAIHVRGQMLRSDVVPETYTVAFLECVEEQESPFVGDLEAFFVRYFLERGETTDAAERKARERTTPYRRTNKTDALGLITLSRARDLLRGLGKWDMEITEAVYDGREEALHKVQEAWDETSSQTEADPLTGVYRPLRGVHFERVPHLGGLRPVYFECSRAILYPGLSPELDKMVQWMLGNGIDEAVYGPGVMVGSLDQHRVWQDGLFVGSENPTLTTLHNTNWRLKVDPGST